MPSKCIVFKCENNWECIIFQKTEILKRQWIKAARIDSAKKFGRSLCAHTKICSALLKI